MTTIETQPQPNSEPGRESQVPKAPEAKRAEQTSRERRKALGRSVGRVILQTLVFVVRRLPLPAALALGRGLGTTMRVLAKKRYRVALKNLRIAYGDTLPQAEQERIARDCFRHFGMFFMESIQFAYMSDEEVNRRIDVTGYAEFAELMERKKGCLFISGHLGNFEIMGRWLAPRGYPIIALARENRDPGTTDIMSDLRERMGIKVITLGQSLKPVLVGLKKNACIAIICDQNATDVFVPFFGHPTGTVDGPARIALPMGAPMLFPYCVRDGRGQYKIVNTGVYEAVSTGDEQADVERVMTEVNARLEAIIREYPEQWLWFHNRWKSSPIGQAPERPNA